MPQQLLIHTFEDLWHPYVLAWTILVHISYLLFVGPMRRGFRWGAPVTFKQKLWFSLGIWTVYLSEGTPLHVLAEQYLFSIHMIQHILLTMVMPPLLLMGLPNWAYRWGLRWRPTRAVARLLTRPLVALLAFNLIYSIWHFPVAYEATLWFHRFHMFQHAVLVFTSMMMWWPIVSRLPELPALNEGMQMFYVFLIGVSQIVVFGFITFADSVMYDFYAAAPRVWPAITPKIDQELAGIIMKVGGMAIMVFVWFIVFFRWASREGAMWEQRTNQEATE